ncbi:hypothetical protein [Sphingobacterium daejeonense]|uniref:hypothetical protein n=1 Tax=Sphingobacterium daejeonense TaxID=371142 RepID=UPI001E4288A7|nr:hypothetical protein [Sphingobacterium daejeonense]
MRFQELLENKFNGDLNEDVLDMMNVRYLITKRSKQQFRQDSTPKFSIGKCMVCQQC